MNTFKSESDKLIDELRQRLSEAETVATFYRRLIVELEQRKTSEPLPVFPPPPKLPRTPWRTPSGRWVMRPSDLGINDPDWGKINA